MVLLRREIDRATVGGSIPAHGIIQQANSLESPPMSFGDTLGDTLARRLCGYSLPSAYMQIDEETSHNPACMGNFAINCTSSI